MIAEDSVAIPQLAREPISDQIRRLAEEGDEFCSVRCSFNNTAKKVICYCLS
jgi:hypothetical protein